MVEKNVAALLHGVQEGLIQEVLDYRPRRRGLWPALAAACLVVAVLAGVQVSGPPTVAELPPLEAEEWVTAGAYGFEAVALEDLGELSQTNPGLIKTQTLPLTQPSTGLPEVLPQVKGEDTLPVYENLAYVSPAGEPVCLTDDQLLTLAEEAAGRLGTVVTAATCFPAVEGDGSVLLAAETAGEDGVGTISVMGNGSVSVVFPEPWTREEVLACFPEDWVADPRTDHALDGTALVSTQFWLDAEEPLEALLQYNFVRMELFLDENGLVWALSWSDLFQTAEKLGDYPVISAQEAREALLAGNYLTSVPPDYGTATEETVVREELIYHTGSDSATFQPYYRFYVVLEADDLDLADGLTLYGVYYVPAVEAGYLTDLPAN